MATPPVATNFADSLVPRPDLTNNAQISPLFFRLPGEIWNIIYAIVFAQSGLDKDARRGQNLSDVPLRTCRQFYVEATSYLYSENKHKIRLVANMAIWNAISRTTSQLLLTKNIGMIRYLELVLELTEKGEAGISMKNIQSLEKHLRAICLYLASNGAVLESLTVEVSHGDVLDFHGAFCPPQRAQPTKGAPVGINELVQDVKNEMAAPVL